MQKEDICILFITIISEQADEKKKYFENERRYKEKVQYANESSRKDGIMSHRLFEIRRRI